MVELIDFLSTSNTVSAVGHTLFLFTNIINFVYLILYDWYLHRRWSRNILSQIMTVGVIAQMVSCVASISRYNMDDEYQKMWSWIGATALHIGLTAMNICSVYLFFNINHKLYIYPVVSGVVAIAVAVTIAEFALWDFLLFLPGRIFLLMSALWQIAAIVSALIAHRKHKVPGIVPYDEMKRQFVISFLAQCVGIGCVLSGMPILQYPGTGIFYLNFVALAVSVGTMDFMPYEQLRPIQYATTKTEDELDIGVSEQTNMESEDVERGNGWKVALWPIRRHQVVQTEHGGIERHIVIAPEAFRMWFYFGFLIYVAIAISVSLTYSELDLNDNPILNRFGNNNICIFFDFPPFSHFATTLWLPQVFTLLTWEWFDHGRVYADYLAKTISAIAYYAYTVLTIYESLAICFFAQITATSPMENMYLHSIPWIFVTFALWTMAFKRLLYFDKLNVFDKNGVGWMSYLGWIYLVLLAVSVIIKNGCNIPNLFEAYLFKRDGLEWTATLTAWNDRVFLVLVIVCPMIIYFTFSKDLPTVKLVHLISR